jgi:hypothetical protein
MGRFVVNTADALHLPVAAYWAGLAEQYARRSRRIVTRFQRGVEEAIARGSRDQRGDDVIARIRDTFHNGLGVRWGEDQVRVFNAFLLSCLPLIYGDTWNENKARVLDEWQVQSHRPYTVVSMARRNGKTFVTSGTVVALLLCVPRIKIAIFSTCKRTSQMMMSAAVDMLEQALEKGTHCNRQDYVTVARNTESILIEGPDRTKRLLGCFPGSVRVSRFSPPLSLLLLPSSSQRYFHLAKRQRHASSALFSVVRHARRNPVSPRVARVAVQHQRRAARQQPRLGGGAVDKVHDNVRAQ